MGEARQQARAMIAAGHPCIFCAGARIATTQEHCPPRALFRHKQWPAGYVFPACASCNGGTSHDDVVVAFLAHMVENDPAALQRGQELMTKVHRYFPRLLPKMFANSPIEARRAARRLKLVPGPGQTYQELGIVNIPPEVHDAVKTLARKLSKATYFMHRKAIFPADGAISFCWFTNAQLQEHGAIPALEALSSMTAMSPEVQREGRDLADQFDYRYSASEDGALQVLQATFGKVFGFVTISSPQAGLLEAMEERISAKTGIEENPFEWLAGGPPSSG